MFFYCVFPPLHSDLQHFPIFRKILTVILRQHFLFALSNILNGTRICKTQANVGSHLQCKKRNMCQQLQYEYFLALFLCQADIYSLNMPLVFCTQDFMQLHWIQRYIRSSLKCLYESSLVALIPCDYLNNIVGCKKEPEAKYFHFCRYNEMD